MKNLLRTQVYCAIVTLLIQSSLSEDVSAEKCSGACLKCDPTTRECLECKVGNFMDPITKECKMCMNHCSLCSNSTTCEACWFRYYLSNDTKSCKACSIYKCFSCSSEDKCTYCSLGYSLDPNNSTNCIYKGDEYLATTKSTLWWIAAVVIGLVVICVIGAICALVFLFFMVREERAIKFTELRNIDIRNKKAVELSSIASNVVAGDVFSNEGLDIPNNASMYSEPDIRLERSNKFDPPKESNRKKYFDENQSEELKFDDKLNRNSQKENEEDFTDEENL